MILLIYNKKICREELLPNIYDTDYRVRLHRSIYNLQEDITLQLERAAAGWTLRGSRDYQVLADKIPVGKMLLKGEQILQIMTRHQEKLTIMTSDVPITFRVMEKYDISRQGDITIGATSDNTICYNFMGLTSASHALLRRQHDGWYIVDNSRNGVFIGNQRVYGSRRLSYGEQIDIFGLHMIFMDPLMLVGNNCGELYIDENRLAPLRIDPPAVHDNTEQGNGAAKSENWFNRSPRDLPSLYREPIEIEAPPAPRTQKQRPAFMVIGPAFTMAIPMSLGCMMSVIASQISGYWTRSSFSYTSMPSMVKYKSSARPV